MENCYNNSTKTLQMVAIAVDYRHSMIHILVAIETVGGMDVSDLLKSKINSLTVKSKSAKLKSIMPEIDRKVSEGVSHEAIIAALAEEGFIVSMPTFRTNLYRYRREMKGREETDVVKPIEVVTQHPDDELDQSNIALPLPSVDFDEALDPKARDNLTNKYMAPRPIMKRNKA